MIYQILSMCGVAVSFGVLGYQIGQYSILKKVRIAADKMQKTISQWSILVSHYTEMYNEASISPSAKVHIEKARDLSIKITNLVSMADSPSKSALHSKYKNEIKQEIINLDAQRLVELKAAIDCGYDPLIIYDGKTQKLSAIVAAQLAENNSSVQEIPKEPEVKKSNKTLTRLKPPVKLKNNHLTLVK